MTSSTSKPNSCVFVVGLKPNEQALTAINRWRDKGYDEATLWNGFEAAATRYIERNYAIYCTTRHHRVPELYSQMEQMLPKLLGSFNLALLAKDLDLDEASAKVSFKSWRMVIEITEFPY